jgi:CBS domain-containing protein
VSEGEAALLKEGSALRKDGNFREALAKFDEVLDLNPKSAAAYREMAIALQTMDEKNLAMDAYKTALKIDPAVRMKKVAAVKREENKIRTGCQARDIMTTDLISVPLGATAKDAAELMLKKNISSVVVREGKDIIGIVTERDFVRNHYYISEKNFASIPIKDLVAYPLVAISADASLKEASNHIGEQGIRHLLVRDGNDIVGLISLRDIVKAYSKFL